MKSSLKSCLAITTWLPNSFLHLHCSLEAETLITSKKKRDGLNSFQVTLPLCCSLALECPSKAHTLKRLYLQFGALGRGWRCQEVGSSGRSSIHWIAYLGREVLGPQFCTVVVVVVLVMNWVYSTMCHHHHHHHVLPCHTPRAREANGHTLKPWQPWAKANLFALPFHYLKPLLQ